MSDAILLLVEVVGVSIYVVMDKLSQKRLYVKLNWLRSLYIVFGDRYEDKIVKTFLLHLLDCILFIDKTKNGVVFFNLHCS